MSILTKPGGDWRKRSPTVRDALGSVVTQLTKNPDVTKFSLPAAFLYPYTVLELGAFRALRCCHVLYDAASMTDPVDRIMQVTKWFLTSVETMEDFNKKPFNPVLGEELNSWIEGRPEDGPTYIKGEQVSHHPPISACVMRNDKHNVEYISNVRFAITFHGNSVSCNLDGHSQVDFKNLGETYLAPKWVPDVVIQNVLFGTRRQLWRGHWEMQCEKSGLGVKYEVTEESAGGWFSSSVFSNIIKGFVYRLDDPDQCPIREFEGLAGLKINHTMDGEEAEFIDGKALKFHDLQWLPKECRPERSSLNVWEKAALALEAEDMGAAETEKCAVEMQQRELRNERREKGEEWVPVFFALDEADDAWKPLPNAYQHPWDMLNGAEPLNANNLASDVKNASGSKKGKGRKRAQSRSSKRK